MDFMKSSCKRNCEFPDYIVSATYFSLDNTNDTLKNIFTVRPPYRNRILLQTEQRLHKLYTIMCEIGSLFCVYTGLSAAAILHDLVLVAKDGWDRDFISKEYAVNENSFRFLYFNRKILQWLLSRLLDGKTPMSTCFSQKIVKVIAKKNVRVKPML